MALAHARSVSSPSPVSFGAPAGVRGPVGREPIIAAGRRPQLAIKEALFAGLAWAMRVMVRFADARSSFANRL
jgi:hypothetical protein